MLFSSKDIQKYEAPEEGVGMASRTEGDIRHVHGQKNSNIMSSLGEIRQGEIINFMTKNRWSAHELLMYALEISGPARVYISTWSISEEAARCLLELQQKKIILDLHCLFDKKVRVRNPVPLQLCMSFPHVALSECHAKVTVVQNEDWSITISGSANMNKNRRIETGAIFTDKETAEFNKQWILQEVYDKENKLN